MVRNLATVQDIIAAKRDGLELSDNDMRRIVLDYAADKIPDYQMAALLMAAYIRGLSLNETIALTRAMVDSGSTVDLSNISGVKVDKHSSGGVGDKTTLVLVPMLAACGLRVPKMSGRGLGFTGGTLDKLESIPGLTTSLPIHQFVRQVEEIGAAIAGQTADLVPADKKIYALRDVTATVDSISLIAASIMSKKIACSTDIILIDVKVGTGAFMQNVAQAKELSHFLLSIGRAFRRRVAVAITDMNQPLGRAVGNALEVAEAVETLKGHGPGDVRELCVQLCGVILDMIGSYGTLEQSLRTAQAVLDDGSALDRFRKIISAQGGDPEIIDNPDRLPRARLQQSVPSSKSGYVVRIDCAAIGRAAGVLGAGRERKEDNIDPAVGVIVRKKLGDWVEEGEALAELYSNDAARLPAAMQLVSNAYVIATERCSEDVRLIHEIVR
jgi:pyrimidine-nucleoside phosphorylase